MHVQVNGAERELPSGATVASLLAELGVTTGRVAVERNQRIVPKAEHGATRLEEGDAVEVVTFVGGG